jgi:hypothetical protein
MKIVLAFLAALALPAVAHASPPRFSVDQICKILEPCLPPAKYDSGSFVEPPVIVPVTLTQIQSICSNDIDGISPGSGFPSIMGCATFEGGKCVVHVPADVSATIPDLYNVVLRHELGHCRGWTHPEYDTASLP